MRLRSQAAPAQAVDLVRHAEYQRELVALMHALTEEVIEGGEKRLKQRYSDATAMALAIFFRRRHGLPVDEHVDPMIYLVGLHRARIRHRAMSAAEVNWSEHWLIRNEFGCDVDALYNPRPVNTQDAASRRLAESKEPDWRDDPTYNLRRRQ